jgi:arylsulfatase A-like enzyme
LGEDAEHHPSARGFEEAITSNGAHFNFATKPKTEYPEGQYLADFLTDQATDFIRRHKDGPFFLYLPHFAVHAPIHAKPELIEHFQPKPAVGGHGNPTYAAMIASVDESVGRILALLEELKIADNTVVIFSSDNGGVGGYSRKGGLIPDETAKTEVLERGQVTDNAPLRSGKGSLYEGGIRTPFIVRWPGVTKPGATNGTPAVHVDVYPTLLEIAGARPPADYVLDGQSLAPLLRDPNASLKRDAIFHHFPGYLGAGSGFWRTMPVGVIHAGDWKLMEYFEDHHLELYNLREDIGEMNNLAAEMPDRAKALHTKLLAWREAIQAPMPTPNTPRNSADRAKAGKGTKKKRRAGE